MRATRSLRQPLGLPGTILVILSLVLSLLTITTAAPPTASASHTPENTYRNPVRITVPGTTRLVQTFADPAIIRAKDGFYYAYATSDPLFEGDRERLLPMIRSNDLVHWTYIGQALQNRPEYLGPCRPGVFAPDIRYMNGQYYLYFSATDSPSNPNYEDDPTPCEDTDSDTDGDGPDTDTDPLGAPGRGGGALIGVLTSPNPSGPWTDRGVAVEPEPAPCCPGSRRALIDPAVVVDQATGKKYIFYGSYFGGIGARQLTQNGLRTVPDTYRQITISNRYEAPYVKKHGDFYYLFVSAADCCRLELTGYSVFAGRSRDPLGPYVDREGVPLLPDPTHPYGCEGDATPPCNGRVGGTPVISMNGNRWVGPGHNAALTDLSGQDWFFYHAIDRNDPAVRRNDGAIINQRPMLMDRLDWIGGWPTVRAEYWASDNLQRAPVTTGAVYDEFNRTTGIGGAWTARGGSWRLVNPTSGTNRGFVRQNWAGTRLAMLLSTRSSPANYRAEFDVKLNRCFSDTQVCRYGGITSYRDANNYIAAYIEPTLSGATFLVTNVRRNGADSLQRTRLGNVRLGQFLNLAVEHRNGTLRFMVQESRLQDYLAIQVRQLQQDDQQDDQQTGTTGGGRIGFVTQFASADFDNASAAQLFTPVTQRRPFDRPGTRLEAYSDEFTDECSTRTFNKYSFTDPLNGDRPAATEFGFVNKNGNCYFRFRTQRGDLFEGLNNASVLASNLPITGDFVAETRVQFNIPPGRCCFNFQQAGVLAYQNDDRYLRLMHVSIWETRQTEFGKEVETPNAYGQRYGNTVVGPPAYTTYLWIVKRGNNYTAYTRQEGKPWIRGGTWTHNLTTVRTGLSAFGRGGPASDPNFVRTADFDYIRVYRLASGS